MANKNLSLLGTSYSLAIGLSLALSFGASCALDAQGQEDSRGDREDSRDEPPSRPDTGPEPLPDRPTEQVPADRCTNTCEYAMDGECDDGGEGADFAECALGTDCGDCGPRASDAEPVECPDEWFDDGVYCDDECFPDDPDCAVEECPDEWFDDGVYCDDQCFTDDPDCEIGTPEPDNEPDVPDNVSVGYSYLVEGSATTGINDTPSSSSLSDMICSVENGVVDVYLNDEIPAGPRHYTHFKASWSSGIACDSSSTPNFDLWAYNWYPDSQSTSGLVDFKMDPNQSPAPALALDCEVDNGRLTITSLSASRLYRGGFQSVWPDHWISISQGSIVCDLD